MIVALDGWQCKLPIPRAVISWSYLYTSGRIDEEGL